MRTELPVLEGLRMNLPAPDVTDATAMVALLADPIRASIVRILRDGPVCVCEMAASLGARENNVSNHLARLRDAGLVRPVRVGSDTRRVDYERDEGAPSPSHATRNLLVAVLVAACGSASLGGTRRIDLGPSA